MSSDIHKILVAYLRLPDTPDRARPHDRRLATDLARRRVPFYLIRTALLLGAARRACRPPGAPPLSPIRSLAYFLPILEELEHDPPDPGYLTYLEAWERQNLSTSKARPDRPAAARAR